MGTYKLSDYMPTPSPEDSTPRPTPIEGRIGESIEDYFNLPKHGLIKTLKEFEGFLAYGDIYEAGLDEDLQNLHKLWEKNTPIEDMEEDVESELRLIFIQLFRYFMSQQLIKSGHVMHTSC